MKVRTVDGGSAELSSEVLDGLRSGVRGELCPPGATGYEEARSIWNAMIDRRPAAVVRAAGASDFMQKVRLAAPQGLLLSVRGGGHNIAGNAVCEGGLMLDLSPMRSVRVDSVAKTVRVEPGARLGDLDKETQAFGLATPTGINSTTGVAGLTLGGGFGWLSRKHGLTVDNLISADVVTEVLVLALCYAGDVAAGDTAARPFRAIGKPIADVAGPHPFAGWQTAFDPLLAPGARNSWKSHDFLGRRTGCSTCCWGRS